MGFGDLDAMTKDMDFDEENLLEDAQDEEDPFDIEDNMEDESDEVDEDDESSFFSIHRLRALMKRAIAARKRAHRMRRKNRVWHRRWKINSAKRWAKTKRDMAKAFRIVRKRCKPGARRFLRGLANI